MDEDTSRDSERAHTSESAAIIAFSTSFHALLEPAISVTKVRASMLDEFGSDFALPKAEVEYLITVSNSGRAPPDPGTLIVTELLPPELSLVVTDFAGPGSGPIQFGQGPTSSGMICTFAGFLSDTDCYAFSTDGTDFTHEPVDSGNGTDPSVTHVRIIPGGFMNADNGSGPTSFTLRFKAAID